MRRVSLLLPFQPVAPRCTKALGGASLRLLGARSVGTALVALLVMTAHPAAAQFGQKKQSFRLTGDAFARYEWTRKIPTLPEGTVDENRYNLQARPRVEAVFGPVELGVGGLFTYSGEDNTVLPDGEPRLIVRDNFFSRDARLDVYYAKIKAGPVVIEGGRMLMSLPLTEMIWDNDLRPRGGILSLDFSQEGSLSHFAIRGIYARGSHWFGGESELFGGSDESEIFGGSVDLAIETGPRSQILFAGSYLDFRKLETLDPRIRRQNTRGPLGFLAFDYRVADVVFRLTSGGQIPFSLAIDYCWNTALSENNKGLWLQAAMGALEISRARLEYTYGKIDRDATVAAFNADDFYWATGVEVHRADLASATGRGSSLHAIASWQRFKDSPIPEERDQWVQRYRIEYRYTF
jgi:hypothetical protein